MGSLWDTESSGFADRMAMKTPLSIIFLLTLWMGFTLLLPMESIGAGLSLSPSPASYQGKPAALIEDGTPGQTEPAPALEHNPPTALMPGRAPVKLQVQRQGIPKALMYRQLQPKRYAQYEQKTRNLKQSLTDALAYLNSLQDKGPELQRISAFSAEVWLDWTEVEKLLTPEERKFKSFQQMQTAATELHSMTHYWINVERVRRVFRGSLREEQQDQQVISAKREKIETALKALDELDKLKKDLNAEIPY
jgi:hypothetical protein